MSPSAKSFFESISALSTGTVPSPSLLEPAAQDALANLDLRIGQFEENLKNPLPAYLFDGQTNVLHDLRKKRAGLLAGTLSIEAALAVEPLPEEAVADVTSEEVGSVVKPAEPFSLEAPTNVEEATVAPALPSVGAAAILQLDAAQLAALVVRVRTEVIREVAAEAATLIIAAQKAAARDAVNSQENSRG